MRLPGKQRMPWPGAAADPVSCTAWDVTHPAHPVPCSGLIEDLRELPSKAALQLRSDSANAAAAASSQAKAVDKSLRRLAKQYGF